MSEYRLLAESRTEFGKGAARRIRRADKVPAVLYGHGTDPVHISLPGHDTMLALKHGGVNALLTIELDGKTQLALTKQVQRDILKGFLEHVDLLVVRRGEKVTVDVPVHVVGDSAPDTLVTVDHSSVSVEAEATNIPEYIEVSVEGAEAGHRILAKDLQLPQGSALHLDDETLIVNVTEAQELELEAEEEAAEAEEPAEGEAGEAAEGESAEGEESAASSSDESAG